MSVATLQAAIDKINRLPNPPEFLLHTGDITHLSRPDQFDNVDQILKSAGAKDVFFVPGEHDVLDDNGKSYLERYGKNAQGSGWYSFDKNGVHFIGLVNVMNLKSGGLGSLGNEQLEWMEKDVKHSETQHADRGLRPHSAVDGLSRMGLGHRRQRPGLGLPEKIRLRHGAQRAYSPDHAKGRGKRDLSHRDVDRISATAARQGRFSRTDESARGTVAHVLGITDVNYVRGQHSLAVVDASLAQGAKDSAPTK